jgi:TolA-binding protein
MKNSTFLVFVMLVFSGGVALHGMWRSQFTPVPRLEAEIRRIDHEKEQAELRAQLVASELADFQQQVATLIPGAMKGNPVDPVNYPLRRLASVVGSGRNEKLEIERASGLMERAKTSFREKLFDESNSLLTEIIEKYPESVHIPEAHFLLAEGQFQMKEYEASIETVEKMIQLFPESELTGFALLRLGRIYEIQDRLEDASDVYRSVINNFHEAKLVDQAKTQLKAVEL